MNKQGENSDYNFMVFMEALVLIETRDLSHQNLGNSTKKVAISQHLIYTIRGHQTAMLLTFLHTVLTQ